MYISKTCSNTGYFNCSCVRSFTGANKATFLFRKVCSHSLVQEQEKHALVAQSLAELLHTEPKYEEMHATLLADVYLDESTRAVRSSWLTGGKVGSIKKTTF